MNFPGKFPDLVKFPVNNGEISGDRNIFCQCGNGRANSTNEFQKIKNVSQIQAVCSGGDHSLLLDVEGCVWVVGCNLDGMLGTETTNTVLLPEKITYLPRICEIYCAYAYSLAIDEQGAIWGSGKLQFCDTTYHFSKIEFSVTLERKIGSKTKSARNI